MPIRMNIIMEDEVYKNFKWLVESEGRTISGLVRFLIKQWIMDNGREKAKKE